MVSGDVCSPCQPLKPHLRPDAAAAKMPGLRAGWSGEGLALLLRDQNEGMDFAAHNVRPTFTHSNVQLVLLGQVYLRCRRKQDCTAACVGYGALHPTPYICANRARAALAKARKDARKLSRPHARTGAPRRGR